MKRIFLIGICFLYSFFVFGQKASKNENTTFINRYLSLVKTEKGFVFTDNKRNQSKVYDYVYLKEYGIIETIIIPPHNPDEMISRPTPEKGCYAHDNSIRKDYHILELMKELKIIDDYIFLPFADLTWANIRDGKVADFACASKDAKFAMVTNKGEFLTDFKYNSIVEDNNKPIFNSYTEKGKLVSVVLDKFTGKEMFATKDSIAQYWNPENHIVKPQKGKCLLTFKSKKYKVPEEFCYLKGLPFESSIFTYRNNRNNKSGFMDIKGNKINTETELIPQTNFYKGHCIAWEVIKEEQKYNYYGEALPRKETRTLKIVNENFETIKVLSEINGVRSPFNKYG
ncbi:MAG TPA: hypothetical protein VLZ72_03990, partial [Flavobacterium sp.]|nr:hypothetical protein [Flavobacterium sp.]